MADLKTVVSQYQELSKEWSKTQNKDLTKIGKLLEQLKLSLTQLSFLPTKGEEASVQVCKHLVRVISCGHPCKERNARLIYSLTQKDPELIYN